MLRTLYRSGRKSLRRGANYIADMIQAPVIVLLYHRVTTLEADPQLLAVTPENFRAHLQYLKANFPILRFEDDWSAVREPAVVITFDDGYADNFQEALPILKELEVPATIFVATGLIGTTHEFWWDELERILLLANPLPPSFEWQTDTKKRIWPTGTATDRQALYDALLPRMKASAAERREEILQSLRTWAGLNDVGRTTHRSLTQKELHALSQSPWITLGAHTVTHSALAVLPSEQQRFEIEASKTQLEEWIGRPVRVFSYPFGCKTDYTHETVLHCRQVNIEKAASNFSGSAYRWTNSYHIPRHLVRNWDLPQFQQELAGFSPCLRQKAR